MHKNKNSHVNSYFCVYKYVGKLFFVRDQNVINEAPEISDLMFWIPKQVIIMPPLAYSKMVHSMW